MVLIPLRDVPQTTHVLYARLNPLRAHREEEDGQEVGGLKPSVQPNVIAFDSGRQIYKVRPARIGIQGKGIHGY